MTSDERLADGTSCPSCAHGGTLQLEETSEADLLEGRTVVIHEVPTLVCDRCGVELFDEPTTRHLDAIYAHAARDGATTYVVTYDTAEPRSVVG